MSAPTDADPAIVSASQPDSPSALSPSSLSTPSPQETLYCPECGYDLRGIADSRRCPECGLTIDPQELANSRIPWVHRLQIGRVRAYWRTVWLATAHTKFLSREIFRPVSYGDAQRFRLVTSVVAAIVPAIAVAVSLLGDRGLGAALGGFDPFSSMPNQPVPGLLDIALPWAAGAMLPAVLPLCIWLFVFAAAGVPSYWFHPRLLPVIKQNRAVALSHYACAPLILLFPAGLCFSAVLAIAGLRRDAPWTYDATVTLGFATSALCVLAAAAFYTNTLRLLYLTTGPRVPTMLAAAILLPLSWIACAGVTAFAVPWVIGYLRIVIESLRM
jgi:hypothetical protein